MHFHMPKGRAKKTGLPPGTVVYVGSEKTEKNRVEIIKYNESEFQTRETESVEEALGFKDDVGKLWINIDGLQKTEVIEKIGRYFNLHPLTLEDIANTQQRPKMEVFENYIFIVLRMLKFDFKENSITSEQVSLVLGSNWLVSFQEAKGDVLNPIRERLRTDKGKIRKESIDYLLYSLIDTIVDNYFTVLEKMGEKIEDIEDQLIENPQPIIVHTINNLKRQSIDLRKAVWPLREVINNLERCESELIKKKTKIYFRDIYDHTIQVIDSVETFRDTLSGMLDVYLSSVSNRMNEIMKVLTMIATIFIPLTLVSGIYGMNFKYMPELDHIWGYPLSLGIMGLITLIMLFYFKKKKWILS